MDNCLRLLGLIYRAKKLYLGEDVLNNLKDCQLLIIASDTSIKNKERYIKKSKYYQLKYVDKYDCESLSKAIGKNNIKLIGIKDKGFADSFLSKLKEG